jgi:hypothetical protein
MPKVLILSKHASRYRQLVVAAGLPGLEKLAAASEPSKLMRLGDDFEVVFGEPTLIRDMLSRLPNLRWVQATPGPGWSHCWSHPCDGTTCGPMPAASSAV